MPATGSRPAASGRPGGEARRQVDLRVERLGVRLTHKQKDLLERAAEITGRSLTDFVVGSAMDRARDTIREMEVIELSDRDARAFIEALENPPRLSDRLYEAMRWHREHVNTQ